MTEEIDLKQVEALASRGLTYEQIAVSLGIDVRTLYNKRMRNAEISEAIKRGRQKGISLVANKLFEQATSGNTTAMIFFLKAQGGWREIQRVESVEVTDEKEVAKSMTTAELLELAKARQ